MEQDSNNLITDGSKIVAPEAPLQGAALAAVLEPPLDSSVLKEAARAQAAAEALAPRVARSHLQAEAHTQS